jgi:glycosyltransferase involved in cell wall biosynthesis
VVPQEPRIDSREVILYVSGEYPPDIGGVGDYTARLRSTLTDLGWPSRVLSRRQVGRWDARSLFRLVRAAPRTGMVHIQFQAGAFDLLGDVCLMPALLRRTRPGVRSVTTFHDVRVPYLFPRAGPLRAAAIRFMARSSDAVVAADQRDLVALGGPSPPYHYVYVPIGPNLACDPPRGYDREAFRASLGLADTDVAIVYFGLLNASKGLDLVLGAFGNILAGRPSARLLLLGGTVGASDPTDRLTAAQFKPQLDRFAGRVIQTGWLPPQDLSAYLLAGDVALLPYADGASGRRGSLLACAEHGLPIVATQPAGAEVAPFIEAVSADARSLADAVLGALEAPSALREKSRALATEMSWSRIAADHVALYRRLLYSAK